MIFDEEAQVVAPKDDGIYQRAAHEDPRIRDLIHEATRRQLEWEGYPGVTRDRAWVDMKRQLSVYVGGGRTDPGPAFLRSEETYEAVMKVLADRLGF